MNKKVEIDIEYQEEGRYQLNVETEYCSFYVDMCLEDLRDLSFRIGTLLSDIEHEQEEADG